MHETLAYLQKKYQLHIITNGFNETQDRKLVRSNLGKYFQEIITSESVGVQKPDPAIFEYALKKAGAQREESIFLGDSLITDMLGAKEFGIDQIYYNPEKKRHRESFSFEIRSLNEMLEIF